MLTSMCCKAFYNYVEDKKICTNCGQIYNTLDSNIKNEESVINIVYNNNNNNNNISGDIIQSYRKRFARCANDPTCILTENKCNKCGSKCRMSRDPTETKIFVCTKCRNVQL